MGGRAEDDAEAPTLAQGVTPGTPTAFAGRESRTEISSLGPGAMIGRYCLARRIGAGAMGVVWSAHDPQLDRSIAIKLVHPSLARSDEAAGRLLREARAMAKLSHRSVIMVHDAGNVEGQLFIAMELIDGTNLGTILRARSEHEVLDWRRWLAIMLEAGKGLEEAHRSGVLHRDFKPDNVLVADSGRIAVGDFGLATLGEETFAAVLSQRADKPIDRAIDLTTTGSLLGTPAYMSPQQLRSEPVDARADQFSFCVAAWEALYGARPFTVSGTGLEALPELVATIETGIFPEPAPGSTVPDPVREVLVRGLAADPGARWPDMGSLLGALEAAKRPATRHPVSVAAPRAKAGRGYLIGGGVLVVAAVATAFLVGRREERTPSSTAPPVVPAKRLFSVPMRTRLAVSSDGTRVALCNDRIQVHSLVGPELWSTPLPMPGDEITYLELVGDSARFSVVRNPKIYRWRYAGDGSTTAETAELDGLWFGSTAIGELVVRHDTKQLAIAADGRDVRTWPTRNRVENSAISPDRRRVAYLESGRFQGRLVVREVDGDREIATPPLISPTSVVWLDDATVLYAAGTLTQPKIFKITIDGDRFTAPVEIYRRETGWFGPMSVHGNRIFLIELHPTPRARMIDRSSGGSSSRDLDNASVSLGWTSATEYLSWSRNTQRIERRGPAVDVTQAVLDGEPANATMAGDLVIASVRRHDGRETIAVSRADGRELWRHADGRTLTVRCADDLRAPCFAIRALETEDQVFSIDPQTGTLGAAPIYRGKAEDIAVRGDGTRLLLVGRGAAVVELDPTGAVIAELAVPGISVLRSVAYDPTGGFLLGGTLARNDYQVGRYHEGKLTLLTAADDDILSFVRPSPDGKSVLAVARVYAPELWKLDLPR